MKGILNFFMIMTEPGGVSGLFKTSFDKTSARETGCILQMKRMSSLFKIILFIT